MSEYQYYEFQSLDRRLTEHELAELRALSSRAVLTPTSASFVYNYGDFRGKPEAALRKHFDAMLYITNWGTRRLMFRLPTALANVEAMKPYAVKDEIAIESGGGYTVLDITINKEEGEWVDTGEGILARLVPLRAAILNGDYRTLYIAWLRLCELDFGPRDATGNYEDYGDYEDSSEDDDLGDEGYYFDSATPEPPVPPNLGKLNRPLEALVDFIELGPNWLAVGAEASPSAAKAREPIEQWIAALPEEVLRRLVLRAAQDEPNIALAIRAELRQRFGGPPQSSASSPPRTVRQLSTLVAQRQKHAAEEKRRLAEEARISRLEALAKREAAAWQEVTTLIEQRNSKSYDQAVSLMCELRELGEYMGEQADFETRFQQISERFRTLSSLKARMVQARLIKS